MSSKRVWLVSADKDRTQLHVDVFQQAQMGYVCRVFPDGASFLKRLSKEQPDVLLLDEQCADGSGLEHLQKFRKHNREAKAVIFAEQPSMKDQQTAQYWGAEFHPPEPDYSELIQSIEGVI